jgi:hypothetical protein
MSALNVYKQVLEGKISLGIAKEYLAAGTQSLVEEIFVFPTQVSNMLQMYLGNKINTEELSEWASFIITSDVYVCPDWENDEEADKYQPMWYILQQLSTPAIDGEITQEGVREHLHILNDIKID